METMAAAVERDLAALPEKVRDSALAAMVRLLAAEFDQDRDLKVAGELRRGLTELARQARPPASRSKVNNDDVSAGQEAAEGDRLDEIAEGRAVRRDELARRRARRAGAADPVGSERGAAAGGDRRR